MTVNHVVAHPYILYKTFLQVEFGVAYSVGQLAHHDAA
jgi:hypothetical protein